MSLLYNVGFTYYQYRFEFFRALGELDGLNDARNKDGF